MDGENFVDPLGEKYDLMPAIKINEEKEVFYDFLGSVGKLAKFKNLFGVYYTDGDRFDALPTERVNWQEFSEGKIDAHLGLYLEGGLLGLEPIAKWRGSLMKKTKIYESKEISLKNSGSIILVDYLKSQIVKDYTSYFSARAKLLKTAPEHPALKNSPESYTEENVGEMLWLQYWNIALRRRENQTYVAYRKPLSYSQRVSLVHSDLTLDKKVVLSELNMLTPEYIKEYKEIPSDWIFRLKGVEDKMSNRDPFWAVPELHLSR